MATGNPVPLPRVSNAWKGDEHRSWLRDGDRRRRRRRQVGHDLDALLRAPADPRQGLGRRRVRRRLALVAVARADPRRPSRRGRSTRPSYNTTITRCLGYSFRSCNMPLRLYWDKPYTFRVWKSHATPRTTGGVLPVASARRCGSWPWRATASTSPPRWCRSGTSTRRAARCGAASRRRQSGDPAKDAAKRLADLLPGGIMADAYWKYVKEWWPMRDEPNVLLLHSPVTSSATSPARCRASPAGSASSSPTTSAQKSSRSAPLTHMKAHPERFECTSCRSTPSTASPGINGVMLPGSMTRKGVDGDARPRSPPSKRRAGRRPRLRIRRRRPPRTAAPRPAARSSFEWRAMAAPVLMQRIRETSDGRQRGRCRRSAGARAAPSGARRSRLPIRARSLYEEAVGERLQRREIDLAVGDEVELVHRYSSPSTPCSGGRRPPSRRGRARSASCRCAVDAEEAPRDRLHPRLEVAHRAGAPRAVGKVASSSSCCPSSSKRYEK